MAVVLKFVGVSFLSFFLLLQSISPRQNESVLFLERNKSEMIVRSKKTVKNIISSPLISEFIGFKFTTAVEKDRISLRIYYNRTFVHVTAEVLILTENINY